MTSSSRARSPTPYDNDFENAESFVDPESPKNLKNLEKIVNLPESTSYDEALCNSDVTMNPIYTSPITTYSNPCHVELVDEENANDVDLTSSMDSRRSRSDDADVESSEEDEGNGNNILNTSMESEDLRYRIDTSQSTMMSSLERSLEIGATRSDGLSDNEMRVQAVKMSIKTHRRTGSVSFILHWNLSLAPPT